MAFITDEDYEVQVRNEILKLLDGTPENFSVRQAERMAIDQIKNFLSGRYDVATIFDATGDARDQYLVMITIDIALYHLWSKRAPRMIPEYRKTRYDDALAWLTDVGQGDITTGLPAIATDTYQGEIRISSRYAQSDYKY